MFLEKNYAVVSEINDLRVVWLTLYKGAILPLLLYGAPVRIEVWRQLEDLNQDSETDQYQNCQIKTEKVAILYEMTKGNSRIANLNQKREPKNWTHPEDFIRMYETQDT